MKFIIGPRKGGEKPKWPSDVLPPDEDPWPNIPLKNNIIKRMSESSN